MNVFEKLYKGLRGRYGQPQGQWSLWCKRPKTEDERQEVVIGAILTQRTNWKNVELALANLKKSKKRKINHLKYIYKLGAKKLAPLIKSSGFYKAKADYLFRLAELIVRHYGNVEEMKKANLETLRQELLNLKGIGEETADSILLYALDKPVFVIDEYTRRLVKTRKLAKQFSYAFLQDLFEKNLRKDYKLYQDFHALVVINGKNKG